MATMKTAELRSLGKGKFAVVDPRNGGSVSEPMDFDAAIALLNTANAEILEEATKPAPKRARGPLVLQQAGSEEKGPKPAMVAYYGDQTTNGRYPAGTWYGSQFRALLAGLPEAIETFNALVAEGKIHATFSAGSSVAKPIDASEINALIETLKALNTIKA